MLATKGL